MKAGRLSFAGFHNFGPLINGHRVIRLRFSSDPIHPDVHGHLELDVPSTTKGRNGTMSTATQNNPLHHIGKT